MLLVNAVNTEGRPLEIFVKDGRIAAVGQELEALAGDNETVVDAGGLTVLPAFVDLHCHWRTPGSAYFSCPLWRLRLKISRTSA